jgi:hypothetical protein
MTKGTITVLIANCVIALLGVLQGVDWVHVAGSSTAGWIVTVFAVLNAAAHALTGTDGLMAPKSASIPQQAKKP